MRLLNIAARAHPLGNRIDLSWNNPDPVNFPGVRVVRREGTHPVSPDDGALVAHGTGLFAATDLGLKGETVYYYRLFPFHDNPPVYDGDLHNLASAVATAPYDFAEQMYALLPAVYHRYDEAQGPTSQGPTSDSGVTAADRAKGQLRRFLDLPGSQFDQIYSLARAALGFYDLDRVEGSLLPLLAQWIGWQTDHRLEVGPQRNEILICAADLSDRRSSCHSRGHRQADYKLGKPYQGIRLQRGPHKSAGTAKPVVHAASGHWQFRDASDGFIEFCLRRAANGGAGG